MNNKKVLIVDDEAEIVELIELYLRREGFTVVTTNEGSQVFQLVLEEKPDLIVLDVLLPGMGGLEVCQKLRESFTTPIIFVSCKSEDTDIVSALGVGGDDYMTKPFSPMQLVARVKAQLRRSQLKETTYDDYDVLRFRDLEINLTSHTVRVQDRIVPLSTKEFELLSLLASHPNRVYRLEDLYSLIWSLDSLGDARTLIVHVSNLRKKIELNPADPRFIVTVRGVGYKFNAEYA